MGMWEEFSKKFQASPAGAVGRAGQDVLDRFGDLLAVPGAPGPMQAIRSGQPNGVPDVARKAVEQWLRSNPQLSEEQYSQVVQWLAGGELADPRLAAQVLQQTVGQIPTGAGAVTGARNAVNAGSGLVDEFGGQTLGPGGGTSQRPSESGIQYQAQKAAPPPVPNAAPPPPASTPPGLPKTGTAGDKPWATDEGGGALLENPEYMMRHIQRQAGLDPERGGMASEFFQKFTGPTVGALQKLYDFLPGQGEGMDYGQVGDNFASFGKQFITPGQSGLRSARDYAHQIATNPEFTSMVGGMDDGTQQQKLEYLMALKNAGARGLRAEWLNKQYTNMVNKYNDSEMGLLPGSSYGQYDGNFTKMMQENPELARKLFGWAGN